MRAGKTYITPICLLSMRSHYSYAEILMESVAGDDFEKGQHVFENYGQANHVYFLYHGFSLDSNTHDCVQVRFPVYAQEVRALEEQGLNKFLMVSLVPTFVSSASLTLTLDSRSIWEFRPRLIRTQPAFAGRCLHNCGLSYPSRRAPTWKLSEIRRWALPILTP